MKLHVPLLLLAALLSSANAASDVENVYIVNQTEAVLTARIGISRAEGIVAITDNDSFVAKDFSYIKGTAAGGAICLNFSTYPEAMNLDIMRNKSVLFENNSARYGGAIWFGIANARALIANNDSVRFLRNTTTDLDGGAIYSENGFFFSDNGDILFEGNEAGRDGGAIYSDSLTTFDKNKSITFRGNKASPGDGGAICAYHLYITNTSGDIVFSGNHAVDDGGAVYCGLSSSTNIISLTGNNKIEFSSNTAGGNGGALFLRRNNTAEIRDNRVVLFSSNKAENNGGAISLNPNSDELVLSGNKQVTFTGNVAVSGSGGALHAYQNRCVIMGNGNVSFTNNHAATAGGALDVPGLIIAANTGKVTFSGNYVRLYDAEQKLAGIQLNSIAYSGTGDETLAVSHGKRVEEG